MSGVFHAGDRGSNPLGDTNEDNDITGELRRPDSPVLDDSGIQGSQRATRVVNPVAGS
jgi:hypothetical protein